MSVVITPDSATWTKVQADLFGFSSQANKALSRALNKTAAWANTRTIRAITDHINIKRSDITGNVHRYGGVTLRKSTETTLTAQVSVTGRRIPLAAFGGKPIAPPTPNGVSYGILRGGGRKVISFGFVVRFASGHTGFFKRQGKGRLPIIELYGPSIPEVALTSPDLTNALKVDLGPRLDLQLGREVNFILTGNSAGGAGSDAVPEDVE